MRADSSVTVPLPDNAPVSAEALRPWLASVICIEMRPAGIASAAIAQRGAIDRLELDACIERNSVGARPGVDGRGRLAAADPALDGVEGQRLAVAPDRAADRAQFAAARQRAAQRLKRDLAAPALQQSGSERLGRVVARRTDGERKGRRKIERVETDFAVDVSFAVKRHRDTPAQPRARYRAVEIVEGQPVARERHARGKADVLRQPVAPA